MSITTLGKVTLGGVTFTTDPEIYEPLNWPKRSTVFNQLGGAVTIQDFGTFAKDNTVRLRSGPQQFMNQATIDAIHTAFRTKGVTFTLTDWVDNEFTVFILSFVPTPTFIGESLSDNLWTYEMDLRVVGITKLLGSVFTGP